MHAPIKTLPVKGSCDTVAPGISRHPWEMVVYRNKCRGHVSDLLVAWDCESLECETWWIEYCFGNGRWMQIKLTGTIRQLENS